MLCFASCYDFWFIGTNSVKHVVWRGPFSPTPTWSDRGSKPAPALAAESIRRSNMNGVARKLLFGSARKHNIRLDEPPYGAAFSGTMIRLLAAGRFHVAALVNFDCRGICEKNIIRLDRLFCMRRNAEFPQTVIRIIFLGA